jgi:hypothetical protein
MSETRPLGEENSIKQNARWDRVYEQDADKLPWTGIPFPKEVEVFFASLDRKDLLLVSGCGAGDTAGILSGKGFTQIVGTDISDRAISIAGSRFPNITFEAIPTQEIPIGDRYRDINSFDWLNLHQVADAVSYLEALAKISKSLCLVWIYEEGTEGDVKSYVHDGSIYMHDPARVRAMVEKAGLRLVREFRYSFSINPAASASKRHQAVGQIYAKA